MVDRLDHKRVLAQGVEAWNSWRERNPAVLPQLSGMTLGATNLSRANLSSANLLGTNFDQADLSGADLYGANLISASFKRAKLRGANFEIAIGRQTNFEEADLSGADLRAGLSYSNFTGANLSKANLRGAELRGSYFFWANLRRANLSNANLFEANLRRANLSGANLSSALLGSTNLTNTRLLHAKLRGAGLRESNLGGADLYRADLSGAHLTMANLSSASLYRANLSEANLSLSILVQTVLKMAILTGCRIYGTAAWDLQLEGAQQKDLIISLEGQPNITADDLEVAQFIYLLLKNGKIRNVIDTITSKAVLVLGRFTPERKVVLNAIADKLREYNLLPIIFDFERSASRDFTETIKTLAGLSLFIIVDITNPKSAPLELQATVPDYQVPFVPIIQEGEEPFSMFRDLPKYPWVLKPVVTYPSVEELLRGFEPAVIERAWEKHQELQKQKTETTAVRSVNDFVESSGIA
jgi:uncharacterized protein YjbI with pentapeptide repeats